MNKIIIFVSFIVSVIFLNLGTSTKIRVEDLNNENRHLQESNSDMKEEIEDKGDLVKRAPVILSAEYALVMNQLKILESYSGTNMNIQLESDRNADDIADHYVTTPYRGVRGLKIRIVVDKFSNQTDMGAVLDDIHHLEKNTDFMASEINKDNNNLIVKGEIYGV